MSTVISRPFRFTEINLFDVPSSDETTWKPVKLPTDKSPPVVTGKFIYAFQVLGSKTELYAEIFADGTGALSVASGRDARILERDKRAVPAPSGGQSFTLPHTINDSRAFYFFVLSRIRLPSDSIANFESSKPPSLGPALDVKLDGTFLLVAGSDGTSTTVESFLPVIDPISIAINHHAIFETACNELIGYTMEFKEQTDDQRQRVRDRHKALLMAKLLKSVVEGDPSDKLGLVNEFQNNDPTLPAQFIDLYDRTVAQKVTTRDKAAEPLLFFLNGKLLLAIEESYRVFETQDYHLWLQMFAQMMERVTESPLGKARMGKLIDSPNFAYKQYVLRTSSAPADQFSVGRKAHSAIVALWREAVPGVLTKTPGAAAGLADALKNISHLELVKVELKTIQYTYRKKNGRLRTVTKQVTETTAIDPATALGKWAKEGVPGRALERLAQGIELMNLMMSLVALADAEPGEGTGFALLNLFGSVLDAVSAFNSFLKIGERSIKIVGGISAVIDTVLATRDGLKAYDRDDTSSAVGFGIVATGSVLTMAGCVCAAVGLGAGATVVGLPLAAFLEIVGAVLVAAGWILAIFSADSEIELFTNHCKFGKSANSSSTEQPKWAAAPFGQWSNSKSGLDNQVRSLLTLLGAFTVKATNFASINVQLGLVMSGSTLHLKFNCLYNLGITHRPDLMIDLGQQTITQIGGDPQDLTKFSMGDSNGRPSVDIEATWPANVRPANAIQHQHCDVEVQLLLDGKGSTVPLAGPLPYLVHNLGEILKGPQSSHE